MAARISKQRPACAHCHVRKIRCDIAISESHYRPCTNCEKLGKECRSVFPCFRWAFINHHSDHICESAKESLRSPSLQPRPVQAEMTSARPLGQALWSRATLVGQIISTHMFPSTRPTRRNTRGFPRTGQRLQSRRTGFQLSTTCYLDRPERAFSRAS
jgi:hypothetical protein